MSIILELPPPLPPLSFPPCPSYPLPSLRPSPLSLMPPLFPASLRAATAPCPSFSPARFAPLLPPRPTQFPNLPPRPANSFPSYPFCFLLGTTTAGEKTLPCKHPQPGRTTSLWCCPSSLSPLKQGITGRRSPPGAPRVAPGSPSTSAGMGTQAGSSTGGSLLAGTGEEEVLSVRKGGAGIAVLNRPKALNSLTHNMVGHC